MVTPPSDIFPTPGLDRLDSMNVMDFIRQGLKCRWSVGILIVIEFWCGLLNYKCLMGNISPELQLKNRMPERLLSTYQ